MKESNSFQDALKRVLVLEKRKKTIPKPKKKKRSSYVAEAMGTSNPTSVRTSGTQPGGTSGMPPFQRAEVDNKRTGIDLRDIGKAEDMKAKNNGRKPYPLETVLDFIAQSGENLQNAQTMVEISLRKNDVSLSPEQKKMLKNVNQIIKSSLGNIVKAAKSINTINL